MKLSFAVRFAALLFGPLSLCLLQAESFEITTFHQFRQLSQADAGRRPSLRLQALVNYFVPEHGRLYLQSGADASFAYPADWNPNQFFRSGDLVEFTGHAEVGGFSPNIAFTSYRILGHPGLPPAPRMAATQMSMQDSECHRARVSGHILAAFPIPAKDGVYESGGLGLAVNTIDGKVDVIVDHPGSLSPARLIGADVEMEGTVAHTYQRGQFTGSMLFVQEAADVLVANAVQLDPFFSPVTKVNQLLRFRSVNKDGRVHISGVVISNDLTESFFLQDDTQGILVETLEPSRLELGEVVDVVGYPEPGLYSPILRYSVFRKQAGFRSIAPVRISSLEIPVDFREDFATSWLVHDGKFVEVEAELIGQRVSPNETSLLLRSKKTVFSAKLRGSGQNFTNLETGSLLRLRGVCTVLVVGVHRRPDGMELLLRSAADVQVLRSKPWWSSTRVVWVLSAAGACLVLLVGWVFTLRVQVRAQTLQLLDRATRDALTKLWNRAEILSLLGRHLDYARKNKSPLSITLIDLDHFKSINDNYGHQAGDAVLIHVCSRLQQNIRNTDSIGRYGGEELLIVQPGLHCGTSEAQTERLREAVAYTPVFFEGRSIAVTCSLGVSCSIDGSASLDDLIKAADAALYQAKRDGRNRAEFRPLAGSCEPNPFIPELAIADR